MAAMPLHLVWGYVSLTGVAAAVLARQSCGIRGTIDHAPQRDPPPAGTSPAYSRGQQR